MGFNLKHTALILPISLLLYFYNLRSRPGPTIKITNGLLQGISSTSRNGNPFYEYLGIPYAVPPIGDLRFEVRHKYDFTAYFQIERTKTNVFFQPPEPARDWEGVRLANNYGPKCVQIEFFTSKLMGNEDCLYLNVFSPRVHPLCSFILHLYLRFVKFIFRYHQLLTLKRLLKLR